MRHHFAAIRRAGRIFPVFFLLLLALLPLSCGKRAKEAAVSHGDAHMLLLDTTRNHTQNVDSMLVVVQRIRSAGDREREVVALSELGHICRNASRYREAIRAHQSQLRLAEEIDDTLMRAFALNDIGLNYRRMGLYYEAVTNYVASAEVAAAAGEGDEKMVGCRAAACNGAAFVYLSVGHNKKAEEMARRAFSLDQSIDSRLGKVEDCVNMGRVFAAQGMGDSALTYYNAALYNARVVGSGAGVAYAYVGIGELAQDEGDFSRALDFFRRSAHALDRERDLWLWMQPLLSIAETFVRVGETDSAEAYLDKSAETARRIGTNEFDGRIWGLYAECRRLRGDWRQAYLDMSQAKAAEDSMRGKRRLFEIETLQYDTDRRRVERERAVSDARLHSERVAKWLFGAGFALLWAVSLLLLRLAIVRKRTNKLQREFINKRENVFANITHDLRMPLTLILALSRDLRKSAGGDVAKKAGSIEKQGESLLSLVNQMLDLQSMRVSAAPADLRVRDLTAYTEMVAERYEEYARSREVVFHFNSRDRVHTAFSPDYLEKVLNNLLSNAFKYTPAHGHVEVTMWSEGKQACIEVRDTGCGISAEALPHVFEPFYRAEGAMGTDGFGIGLPLARETAEAMGGTLTVKSEVGRGSVFRLTLPLAEKGAAADADAGRDGETAAAAASGKPLLPAEAQKLSDTRDGHRSTILVVDDNRSVAAYIGSLFTGRHNVLYAHNGAEGFDKAVAASPDLVVTDLTMPKMDGEELCRKLRADGRTADIPIVVVTARVGAEDRLRSLEAGADAYLAKPFRREELLTHVARLLKRRVEAQTAAAEEAGKGGEDLSRYKDADKQFLTQVTEAVRHSVAETRGADVQTVSERMCMSTSSLYRRMTSLTGYTPAAYIQRVKVKMACRMLDTEPGESFAAVAERCGFGDYSSFVRAFRNVCGLTPSQYVHRCD